MAADLEDVSNSNTGYLKETEDLEDDGIVFYYLLFALLNKLILRC